MGAREKIRVLIPIIKKLLKSIRPIKIILQEDLKPTSTYLHSIYIVGQKNEYTNGIAVDIKQMLKSALEQLEESDRNSKLTVRLLVGETMDAIDTQIDFSENKYNNIQIAF